MKEFYWAGQEIIDIHSSEAYYVNPFFLNDWFVMPYISLGVNECTLNPDSQYKYIDFAYIICKDIQMLKYNERPVIDKDLPWEHVFGGNFVFNPDQGGEFFLSAKEVQLVTFEFSRLSNKVFTILEDQITNPACEVVDKRILNDFIRNKYLPSLLVK